jgi:phage-related protein
MESSSNIDFTDDYRQREAELNALQKEFSTLFTEKDEMVSHENAVLTSLFLSCLGDKKYQLFSLQTEVKSLTMKRDMLQAYVNRDEKPDVVTVNREIDRKLEDYYKVLRDQEEQLKAAKKFLSGGFLSSEETKEIKDIYHVLVKQLHPDLHPEQTEEEQELFLKAQAAYRMSELQILRDILLKLGSPENKEKEICTIDLIQNLKDRIGKLKHQIAELNNSFPFIYRENLKDEKWIKAQVDEIDAACAELEKRKSVLLEIIDLLIN